MSAPTLSARETCPHCGAARTPGAGFCTSCGGAYSAPADRGHGARHGLRGKGPRLRGAGNDLPYVMIAALLVVVLSHLPLIGVVVYPFKLFGTFVHEWSHALAAIFTGVRVDRLQINADLSGETYTYGINILIASAGYVGAAVIGALLLLSPTRFANKTLVVLGAVSLFMPLIGAFSFGTSFPATTWLWTLAFGLVTVGVGLRARTRWAALFQQFVAVELCFTALDSIRDLIWLSVHAPSVATDALNADHYTHLPALFWSILWGVLALTAIGLSATRVVRRSLV